MRTVLIDYQSGNLHSAHKAFERMAREGRHGEVLVTSDPETVAGADRIVLPGDGAFPACRDALLEDRAALHEALEEAVLGKGRPFLGICVGMQLMASRGQEYRQTDGLGWIAGEVVPIRPADPAMKVPHMGWNELVIAAPHPVLEGIETGEHAYFVHSYQFKVENRAERLSYCDYGGDITAIIGRGNILGMQFHPEKSQAAGLRMIGNFLSWAP